MQAFVIENSIATIMKVDTITHAIVPNTVLCRIFITVRHQTSSIRFMCVLLASSTRNQVRDRVLKTTVLIVLIYADPCTISDSCAMRDNTRLKWHTCTKAIQGLRQDIRMHQSSVITSQLPPSGNSKGYCQQSPIRCPGLWIVICPHPRDFKYI